MHLYEIVGPEGFTAYMISNKDLGVEEFVRICGETLERIIERDKKFYKYTSVSRETLIRRIHPNELAREVARRNPSLKMISIEAGFFYATYLDFNA